MKKSVALLSMIIALFVVLMSTSVFAVDAAEIQGGVFAITDMPNDWSKAALERAVENGLLTGYAGKIMPKDFLTRAQMAAVVNRAFGASKQASLARFSDVPESAWYHDDMAAAVQMKTFVGSGSGKLNPENKITREEAFWVLARAFRLSGADGSVLDGFSDSALVSEGAKDSAASLVQGGYIHGAHGKLNPKQYITRAEFAQIMDNLLKYYINEAGTYTDDKTGNLMVNVPGVTLQNMTIAGDLVIGDGVGDGDVTLDNVLVEGRTVVRGGGANSIRIIGSSDAGTVIVLKIDGVVSVKVQGDAHVGVIYIDDGSDDVILVGPFGDIELQADNVTVTATDASIDKIQISGNNSKVIVGTGSDVGSIGVTGRNAEISGAGTVQKVNVLPGGDNTSITTPNTRITVSEDAAHVTGGGGETVSPGSNGLNNTAGTALVKSNDSDDDDDSPGTITLTAIGEISGTAEIGQTLTRGALSPVSATAAYQWMVSDTEDGEYAEIMGATGTTFTIPEGYAGKFLKVRATGTNRSVGTVISAATSTIEAAEFSITASAGGDAYLNGEEATASAPILVTPVGGTLSSVQISGVRASNESPLTVTAVLNDETEKYEFDATLFKDGELTVTGTNPDSAQDTATLILDTLAAKLITGGKLVELTGEDNPLSVVQVSNWAFPSSGDLNDDDLLDVVVGDMAGHITTYYQQDGAYLIADPNPLVLISPGMYTFPGLGDLDGDEDLDLVVSLASGLVQYYQNTGTLDEPVFTLQENDSNPFSAVNNPMYAFNAVGDVDVDGDADVVFGYGNAHSGTLSLDLWTNDGAGVFTKYTGPSSWFSEYSVANGDTFVVPYLGDFNGDGELDAAVYTSGSPEIVFYEGDGTGTYSLNETQNPFEGIAVNVPFASAGDIDGDGDADFLIGDDGGVIRSFRNNVGEAVNLASSQIVAGLDTDNVTTEDTESLLLSGKGAESLAEISIYVNGNLLTDDIQADDSGEWNFTWLGTEEGFEIVRGEDYVITVSQRDIAGNISEISDSYTIRVRSAK